MLLVAKFFFQDYFYLFIYFYFYCGREGGWFIYLTFPLIFRNQSLVCFSFMLENKSANMFQCVAVST